MVVLPVQANGLGTRAKGRQPRCYHGRRKCSFCAFPRPTIRHRLRCATCGRFVKGSAAVEACPRCRVRGFCALRLF